MNRLRKVGLLNNRCDKVKLLGDGEVEKAFSIEVNKVQRLRPREDRKSRWHDQSVTA